jgi:hypothetical protein
LFYVCIGISANKRSSTNGLFFHGFPKRRENETAELPRISALGKMRNKIFDYVARNRCSMIIDGHFKLGIYRACLLTKEEGSGAVSLAKGLGNSVVFMKASYLSLSAGVLSFLACLRSSLRTHVFSRVSPVKMA